MKQLWIVAMAACGGTKAATTPVTNAHADEPVGRLAPTAPLELAAPRPEVDLSALVPDPTEEARWPLSINTHPVLEPHFDIAGALAQPGIGWLDLCQRGAQNRRLARDQDLAEYLHAWCSVADHDTRDALYRLGQLHGSTVLGLADAVKHDCADILADHGDSHDVEGLLSGAHLMERDIVDLLAASYFEVGRNDDAYQINELARGMDRIPRDDVKCRRIVRGIIVGHEWQQLALIGELHQLVAPNDANKTPTSDSTCIELDAEVQCWHDPENGCVQYVQDRGKLELLRSYFAWPRGVAAADRWGAVVSHAMSAIPLDDAYRLAIPATKLAVRTSSCDPSWIRWSRAVVLYLGNQAPKSYVPELDELERQLKMLAEMSRRDCRHTLGALPPP